MKKMKFRVTPKLSEKVQEKLFTLGYSWYDDSKAIHTDAPFLYADIDGKITYGDSSSQFDFDDSEEINPIEFIDIADTIMITAEEAREEANKVSGDDLNVKNILVDIDRLIRRCAGEHGDKTCGYIIDDEYVANKVIDILRSYSYTIKITKLNGNTHILISW